MELDKDFTLAGHLPTALNGHNPAVTAVGVCSDRDWMKRALLRAMETSGLSEPNPTVGCIIVKNGRMIAGGSSQAIGGRHAERMALDSLADPHAARGATLYCTLEPCSHTGRQPPCSARIIEAGIARCVIGIQDSDPKVNGSGIAWLKSAGISVQVDVLRTECAAWHLPFLMRPSLDRPLIAAKWAQTMDGQLAYDGGVPQSITGPIAKRYSHWLRHRYDAIMVGASTVLNDLPRLNVRHVPFVKHRDPVRVIVDPHARLLTSDRWPQIHETVFAAEGKVLYIGSEPVDAAARQAFAALDLLEHVVVSRICPFGDLVDQILNSVTDHAVLARLGRPIDSLLIEGGPRLHALFMDRDLADVTHLLMAPVIGGGRKNRVTPSMNLGRRLHATGTYMLGGDLLFEMVGGRVAQLIAPIDTNETRAFKHLATGGKA